MGRKRLIMDRVEDNGGMVVGTVKMEDLINSMLDGLNDEDKVWLVVADISLTAWGIKMGLCFKWVDEEVEVELVADRFVID